MNRALTILLVLLTAGVAVFLFVFEPRLKNTREHEADREFVLHFDPTSIRGIRIASGDDEFEISLRDDAWRIGPKPKDFASLQKVSELLKAAGNLRVFDVIPANDMGGRNLDDFGLDNPKSHLDLVGDGEATVYFGKEAAGDGRVFVRRGDSNDIYIVSDELQGLAFRNPQDFRDRRLTNLTPDRIDKFTIKRGAGEIALERGGHGWEVVRPLRARADDAAVEKLLNEMLGMRIEAFVADEANDLSAFGLAEPRAELILNVDGSDRPLALRIGTPVAGKKVLAQYTARDSVYHLPERAWTALQIAPEALRDRRVAELNMDTVDAIRFNDGKKETLYERSGDGWKSGDRKLTDEEVSRQAGMLADAKVIEYLPLTDENLSKSGLDKPVTKIFFDAWLSENTPETTAGRHPVLVLSVGKQEAGKAYVRVNDDPEICVIPSVASGEFP
ncbi:MAG: DUF4340 domain-containing protein [Chthoniobacterales bacterium]